MTDIPLRCLCCGNAVMTPRQPDEEKAIAIESLSCVICDTGGEKNNELFYVGPDGRSYDFGAWMDFLGIEP